MTGSDRKSDHKADAFQIGVSLFDPRRGDVEDDASSPKQTIPACDRRQPARRNQPAEACFCLDVFDPAAGGAARLGAAGRDGLVSESVEDCRGNDRARRSFDPLDHRRLGDCSDGGRCCGLREIIFGRSMRWRYSPATRSAAKRCATWLSACSAKIPASPRARDCVRSVPPAAAIILCICGGADRHRRLAGLALGRDGGGSAVCAPPYPADARQRRRRGLGIFCRSPRSLWGFADASMDQPVDLAAFDAAPGGSTWRIAHLSDIHHSRRAIRISYRKRTQRAARQ